jgi:DNA-binding response OmpR family regulator
MKKPGEVVPRDILFQRVWETNYIGDTRTLDVHISWLRRALEEDPHNPKLILTVRSIGYKLDL